MRAALLIEPGQPLTVVDGVEVEPPRTGEVLVRVAACGVCHSDVHYLDGVLTVGLPAVLGHEAAGVVEEVGPGVEGLAPGDKVVLTMRPQCGRCYWCVRGEGQLCSLGDAAVVEGAYADGGTRLRWRGSPVYRGLVLAAFAERTVVPAAAAVKVPADTPLDVAAVLGCAVQTGVGAAVNTARVRPGDTVAVAGLGGVGIAVVQGARLAGAARIIGADPVAERRERALRFGATDVVDPEAQPLHRAARELTGGVGVDAAFDAVGRASVVESLLKATRNGGVTVMVGVPRQDETVAVPALLHNVYEKKLVGCYLGSANPRLELPRLLALWRAGRLDLEGMVTARRPLDEIGAAVADLVAGRGLRTVITP